MKPTGFPHSEILVSMSFTDSTRLIAGLHVLHRLSMPRHPPEALSNLVNMFSSPYSQTAHFSSKKNARLFFVVLYFTYESVNIVY
jgi:hypothetical protein